MALAIALEELKFLFRTWLTDAMAANKTVKTQYQEQEGMIPKCQPAGADNQRQVTRGIYTESKGDVDKGQILTA